ncbi:MAG TPA: hypothetical protein VMN36_14515 [Verrucomicrobiales bacterium]|nr:hypothetical protein [Verrucomicrobiales bacterium]
MTPSQARRLVSEYETERIERQLDALEFLIARAQNMPANHGGWLFKAITENYSAPKGFKSRAEREQDQREKETRAAARAAARKAREETKRAADEAAQIQAQARRERIAAYLDSLPAPERQKLEKEALARSPLARGRLGAALREAIIHNHAESLLKEKEAPPEEH